MKFRLTFVDFCLCLIGQNENLVVVLSLFQPNVVCGPKISARGSRHILDVLPAGFGSQVFGRARQPGVQVVVPKYYQKKGSSSM